MGLFDKLFGGKTPEPADVPSPLSSPTPTGSDGPIARRERSKPGSLLNDPALNTPGTENALLLQAIAGIVQADNAQTRTVLYETLLTSLLYLVCIPPEGDTDPGVGEIKIAEGQQLSLATIHDNEGRIYLPAFTDLARLTQSLPERGRYVRLAATSVCRMFLQGEGQGIVINPSQPPSGIITRAEAQALSTGVAPQIDAATGQLRVDQPQQMRIAIGKAEVPPADSFVEAIRGEAAKHAIVREVHLYKAGVEDQPPRLMIGLLIEEGLTPELMHPVFESIGKAAFDARGDTEEFDMMPLNDQMIDAIRPLDSIVYSREQQV